MSEDAWIKFKRNISLLYLPLGSVSPIFTYLPKETRRDNLAPPTCNWHRCHCCRVSLGDCDTQWLWVTTNTQHHILLTYCSLFHRRDLGLYFVSSPDITIQILLLMNGLFTNDWWLVKQQGNVCCTCRQIWTSISSVSIYGFLPLLLCEPVSV